MTRVSFSLKSTRPIAALSHGCQLPGRERIMRCRFCGIGTYETLEGGLVAGPLVRT